MEQSAVYVSLEFTPNPNTLKFVTNQALLPNDFVEFQSIEETDQAPMAKALFGFGGVTNIFFSNNFVSITKSEDKEWIELMVPLKDFLKQHGVPEEKIHIELFTTSESQQQKTKPEIPDNNGRTKSNVTVKLDGISFNFDVDFYGRGILDEALKNGADLPYSCKGGVCCTCKALLLEGEVKMDVHYGLEQEEIELGYILACQSDPVTEKVVIDFDIK